MYISLAADWTGALLLGGRAEVQMKHRRTSSTFYSKFQVCVSVCDDTVFGECPRHPGPGYSTVNSYPQLRNDKREPHRWAGFPLNYIFKGLDRQY